MSAPEPSAIAAEPAPAAPAPPAEGSAAGQDAIAAIVRALSARDSVPACAEIEALAPAPVEALLAVVQTVQMPPTVPMRAAGCLIERHAAEIEPTLISWMNGPETLGLALLVADSLDCLTPALATRAASAGLAGPHADKLRPKFASSAHPSVSALVTSSDLVTP